MHSWSLSQISTLAEAAAVAEECWASAVEALCAGRGTTSPRGNDLEVVVLTFGRDGLAFDNALLTSPPALRAVELGVDIKPGWANGAKVFVPGLSATDVAEIRVDLLPRHVVALASDVQQILEALTSLPSRSRPRLKAGKPAVPIPGKGDISLFTDVSCGSGSSINEAMSSKITSTSSSAAANNNGDTSNAQCDVVRSQLPDGITVKWTFLHEEEPLDDALQSSRTV